MDIHEASVNIEAQMQQNIAMSQQIMSQQMASANRGRENSQMDEVARQAEAVRQDIKKRLMEKGNQ